MEIILMERVENLGQIGDVVTVKPGFARNYLLPRGKALRANNANKKVFEDQRAQLEADNLKKKGEAEAVAAKMDDTKVVVIRQAGEGGQLYGSVNARDVASALTDGGFTVGRNQVALAQPIKTLGLHTVIVALHPEVSVTVTANVARSADEAELQEQTGHAVNANDEFEDDAAPDVEDLVEAETAEAINDADEETADDADAPVEAAADEGDAEEAPAE